jgi:hypothetical protein
MRYEVNYQRFLKPISKGVFAPLSLILIVTCPAKSGRDSVVVGLTTRLPAIDKIELQEVEANELWIKRVVATKTIQGPEAQAVARLWRSQKYSVTGDACHRPVYAIRFYSQGKSIAYASLCWECKNIFFIEPNINDAPGFAANGTRGRQLLAVFKKAFP